MNAAFLYLAGSLILLVGTVVTSGPTFLAVSAGLFTLGSLVAIAQGTPRK